LPTKFPAVIALHDDDDDDDNGADINLQEL
jgi:hypothetical protein